MKSPITSEMVARELLRIGAVGLTVDTPIKFKSGIMSPVYCDNRKFPFHPSAWRTVIEGFSQLAENMTPELDVIAGVEAAGIPHSAALGYYAGIPSVFVRKAAKDHGTKKLVEGGDVAGKNVLLVEDLVTTGGSSLTAVQALRSEGAIVTAVATIVSYDFPEAVSAFEENRVDLLPLTTFPVILQEAKVAGKVSEYEFAEVTAWLADPHGWRA